MRWLLLILIFILSLNSYAERKNKKHQELSMVALEFSGAIQSNKKGAFDLMLKDLAKATGIPHEYEVMSAARGARKFFRKKAMCVIPSSLHPPYFENYQVIHSEVFATARYMAFAHNDSVLITNKAQMSGKLIGILRDAKVWNYKSRLALKNVNYIQVSNLKSLVNMLDKKRIDIAIHDRDEFITMAQYLNISPARVEKEFLLAIDKVVITCHDTPISRAYLKIISPELQKIITSGIGKYFKIKS